MSDGVHGNWFEFVGLIANPSKGQPLLAWDVIISNQLMLW